MSKEKNNPIAKPTAQTVAAKAPNTNVYFVFGKMNYIIAAVGLILVLAGYFLMRGGGTDPAHPEIFDAAAKYSFTRITLAPAIIVLGLVVEVFAIMYKSND